ncbi:hypothetical protein LOTGIDRAFT_124064, partial [Lottia gigantea]
KVVEWKHPHELEKLMDLKIKEDGTSKPTLLDMCRQIVKYSVKTGKDTLLN